MGRSRRRALLIHGFPGTPWELRAVGAHLVRLGFEVHCPLLPGFGPHIESLGERSWHDWEEAVEEACRLTRQEAEELLVVGYSMGGALAMRLALREEVDRLVLINPFSGLGFPLGILLPLVAPFLRSYRPFGSADFSDPWTREVVGRVLPDLDVDDLTWQQRLRNEVKLPVRAIEQVRRLGVAAWRAAPQIDVPALVVQGEADAVVPASRTRRLADRLGGPVVLREAPAAGHVLIWPEKPGHSRLIREIERFTANGALRRTG